MRSQSRGEVERTFVVVSDTSVLINLLHIERTDLFARTPGYEFILPEEVINEVTDANQHRLLQQAIADGFLARITITDTEEIALMRELSGRLGAGESACLAVAKVRDCVVATDDGLAARVAAELLGEGRVLTTPGLLVLAIRAELITINEADGYKRALEARRFVMGFDSFGDVV